MPAIEEVSRVTGVAPTAWRIYYDRHQISTREKGKSSCAFLAANFDGLDQAVVAMKALRRDLPGVNFEIFVAPDGRYDQGDGIGSYDGGSSLNKLESNYIADKGFSVALLVDAQNVDRHLRQRLTLETEAGLTSPERSGQSPQAWNWPWARPSR